MQLFQLLISGSLVSCELSGLAGLDHLRKARSRISAGGWREGYDSAVVNAKMLAS